MRPYSPYPCVCPSNTPYVQKPIYPIIGGKGNPPKIEKTNEESVLMVVRVTHNIIPAVQRPQMPANNNRNGFANSKVHCKRKRKRSQRAESAFDARGDRLSVYDLSCVRKTQLEVCANPAQDLLQCWVVREPVSLILIGSAELIDNSGVGDCSKLLIFWLSVRRSK